MNPGYQDNWNFQLDYYKEVERLLKQNAYHFINVSVADADRDKKQATDFVINIEGGDIAVRIRRSFQHYRDLTIRSRSRGYKTEIHKILEGWARYYLYCWTDSTNNISEWMLIDLNKVRENNLLNNRQEKINKDGVTGFVFIPYRELEENDCILSSDVKVGRYA